uniref:Cytochrome b6-f complex subunit 6 n=1 Tax=Ostreobium sp. HV05007bc TaxID=1940403 RepID=A0A1X9ZI47_9CHLO|nr:cytochrome b6-f complex subunit 6 [Ostreobium sp. HV05007bc]UXE31121.1 cytochrome b6-f complex subunit 6 [Ostreobium quekettii]
MLAIFSYFGSLSFAVIVILTFYFGLLKIKLI